MPKRHLNFMDCEVMRFYTLMGVIVEPISFTVPRKVRTFILCVLTSYTC